jgi:hypothetical protein
MNTLDTKEQPGIFALFKGPSGSGKSVGALSFPDPEVLDLDCKMPAIANKHFRGKSIEYNRYPNIWAITEKVNSWMDTYDDSGNLLQKAQVQCPHETIIFDSITSLCRLIMNSIATAKGESTPQMLKTIKPTKGGKKMVELMGYDYYNAEVRYIDWILSAAKMLYTQQGNPKNIIFIAHIIETSTKPNIETGLVTKTRSIFAVGNKAPAIIPTEFDEVYLFGTQEAGNLSGESEIRHIMTTETTGDDDAKTAFKIQRRTDFTNQSLYDLLQGQIAGSEMFT